MHAFSFMKFDYHARVVLSVSCILQVLFLIYVDLMLFAISFLTGYGGKFSGGFDINVFAEVHKSGDYV